MQHAPARNTRSFFRWNAAPAPSPGKPPLESLKKPSGPHLRSLQLWCMNAGRCLKTDLDCSPNVSPKSEDAVPPPPEASWHWSPAVLPFRRRPAKADLVQARRESQPGRLLLSAGARSFRQAVQQQVQSRGQGTPSSRAQEEVPKCLAESQGSHVRTESLESSQQ